METAIGVGKKKKKKRIGFSFKCTFWAYFLLFSSEFTRISVESGLLKNHLFRDQLVCDSFIIVWC